MYPPTKDQADIGVEDQLLDASDSPDNPDRARQEYKQDADINYMLSRFGITQPRGTPTYGEWDDNIDLQQALDAVAEARAGYRNLPEELRNKFGSMEDLLRAVENGSLVLKDEEAPKPVPSLEERMQTQLDKLNARVNNTASTHTEEK